MSFENVATNALQVDLIHFDSLQRPMFLLYYIIIKYISIGEHNKKYKRPHMPSHPRYLNDEFILVTIYHLHNTQFFDCGLLPRSGKLAHQQFLKMGAMSLLSFIDFQKMLTTNLILNMHFFKVQYIHIYLCVYARKHANFNLTFKQMSWISL